MKALLVLLLTLVVLPAAGRSLVGPATAAAQTVQSGCDAFAAPHRDLGGPRVRHHRRRKHRAAVLGSRARPFLSLQRLVNALRSGQTGCLERGTYRLGGSGELSFGHSGRPGAPITLRSAPGQHATIIGGPVFVPHQSNDIRIADMSIDTRPAGQIGVQIMSRDDALVDDRITNRGDANSCIILGNDDGWGPAVGTVIAGDVIHGCGSAADGNQDQAIYLENSTNATVANNVIWGTSGFAIHLYDNARGNVIRHNVLVHNRYGVIFGGDSSFRSSGNIVIGNVIADTTRGYGVQAYWGGAVGIGNLFAHNCIFGAAAGSIDRPTTGFLAIDNVTARPDFLDAARHRYALLPGSRCLDVVGFDWAQAASARARRVRRAAAATR